MRMPGFSAEASLYRSSKHYQAGAMLTGLGQGEVVPSLRLRTQAAKSWCYDLGHAFCCCNSSRCCCRSDDGNFCWPRVAEQKLMANY